MVRAEPVAIKFWNNYASQLYVSFTSPVSQKFCLLVGEFRIGLTDAALKRTGTHEYVITDTIPPLNQTSPTYKHPVYLAVLHPQTGAELSRTFVCQIPYKDMRSPPSSPGRYNTTPYQYSRQAPSAAGVPTSFATSPAGPMSGPLHPSHPQAHTPPPTNTSSEQDRSAQAAVHAAAAAQAAQVHPAGPHPSGQDQSSYLAAQQQQSMRMAGHPASGTSNPAGAGPYYVQEPSSQQPYSDMYTDLSHTYTSQLHGGQQPVYRPPGSASGTPEYGSMAGGYQDRSAQQAGVRTQYPPTPQMSGNMGIAAPGGGPSRSNTIKSETHSHRGSPKAANISSPYAGHSMPLRAHPPPPPPPPPPPAGVMQPHAVLPQMAHLQQLPMPVGGPAAPPPSQGVQRYPYSNATPVLLRTTTLTQQISSLGPNALSNDRLTEVQNPRASLEIVGNLDALARDWTLSEWQAKRRLITYQHVQDGPVISVTFSKLDPESYTPTTRCISCIRWEEKDECYFTSVDCIALLEVLVNTRFSVEEKNRIRRNLEGYRPLTVAKSLNDSSDDFFKLIMGFNDPKPRNIEKNVKVFPWKILGRALKKIVGKYSADYTHSASLPPQLQTVVQHGASPYGYRYGGGYAPFQTMASTLPPPPPALMPGGGPLLQSSPQPHMQQAPQQPSQQGPPGSAPAYFRQV